MNRLSHSCEIYNKKFLYSHSAYNDTVNLTLIERYLQNNQLTGCIPFTIGKLSGLEALYYI